MVVILDHATDRNVDSQFFQYGQRNIHLSATAVHQNKIRELREASVLLIHLLSLIHIYPVWKPVKARLLPG